MNIIAVDDNASALNKLKELIQDIMPGANIICLSEPKEVIACKEKIDIVFMETRLGSTNGLELAQRLMKIHGKINIVFVTEYPDNAVDAFTVNASGYILKPATSENIREALSNLRYPPDQEKKERLTIRTFGTFEVWDNKEPLRFRYNKTKEMLAYLVDRNGAAVNTNVLCAILWEDKQDTSSIKAQLRNLTADLLNVLKSTDSEDIIYKRHNIYAVVPDKINCDYYGFLNNDPRYISAFKGEYMSQYSWSEMTASLLKQRKNRLNRPKTH